MTRAALANPTTKAMAESLRPMKIFLGKTWVCVVLAGLPIAVLEGLRSDPDTREYARMFDGSVAMWVTFPTYVLGVFLLWCRWVTPALKAEARGQEE